MLAPGLGANGVAGGAGADTVVYGDLGGALGVTVGLVYGVGGASGPVDDDLLAVENVTGTPNADDITAVSPTPPGPALASALRGRGGADTLTTADGDSLDAMHGGEGTDTCNRGRDADSVSITC